MIFRFDTFELRPIQRLLLCEGLPLKLGGRAFDLLQVLIEQRHRVVPKAELMDLVWPKLVVEENNLQVHVMALRRLLGPHAIATVPGRGYRFVALLDDEARGSAAEHPAPAPATAVDIGTLFGRDADLAALQALLAQRRLVTLVGAGGVGKSRLAQAVLQTPSLSDEASHWVDLSHVTDAPQLIDAIATTLGLAVGRGDPLQGLAAALAPLSLLLVLDNAEAWVEPLALLVRRIHDSAPALRLLVTSQVPLRIGAETICRLEPLALPDPEATLAQAAQSPAVQLFLARARAADRHFALDEHKLAPVVSLCRRLDGLPLALEMAAARVPALTPAQLDDALRERFRVLTAGDRSAPPRQQTLHAALGWTHGLLGTAEQTVFRRLAVFAGGFSLDAAQHVCSDHQLDDWTVLDALATLVECSLVTAPLGEPPRYRLLDTPRAFAGQQLQAAGETDALARRHALTLRQLYGTAYAQHMHATLPLEAWRALWSPDVENGRQALAWAVVHDPETAAVIAPGLAQALGRSISARYSVWRATEALDPNAWPAPVRAPWLLGWAQYLYRYKPGPAVARAGAAAALFAQAADRVGEYRALAVIATRVVSPGADDEQCAALERMRTLEDPAWPPALRVLRRYAEFTQAGLDGRSAEALALGESCLTMDPERSGEAGFAHVCAMMYLEISAGRFDAAIERGNAARQRSQAELRAWTLSGMDMLLVLALALKGEPEGARELAPGMWAAARQLDFQAPVALVLALIAALEARPRCAVLLLGYAAAEQQRSGYTAQPVGLLARDRTEALARERLPSDVWQRLLDHGATCSDVTIGALAFARVDADDCGSLEVPSPPESPRMKGAR